MGRATSEATRWRTHAAGDGQRLLHDYRQLRLAQLAYSRELGMTPAARMALQATGTRSAFDLPSEMLGRNTAVEDGDDG